MLSEFPAVQFSCEMRQQITVCQNARGSGSSKSLSICVACARITTLIHRQYVAGLGFLFKMQLDPADIELMQDPLDTLFDRRMVGAIAGDEFFDNSSQCRGRQLQMGNAHRVIVPPTAKSVAAPPSLRAINLASVSSKTQQARQVAQRERRRSLRGFSFAQPGPDSRRMGTLVLPQSGSGSLRPVLILLPFR